MAPAYAFKALALFQGKPLLEHALTNLDKTPDDILISCGPRNRQTLWEDQLVPMLSSINISNQPVFDHSDQQQGPLAGILSGLQYCQQHRPDCEALLISPVDTPKQPRELPERLLSQYSFAPKKIISAQANGRIQPLHSLWPLAALDPLRDYLEKGERRVMAFLSSYGYHTVDFQHTDDFHNINTPDDLVTR